jgi:hypothetical protein
MLCPPSGIAIAPNVNAGSDLAIYVANDFRFIARLHQCDTSLAIDN